MIFSSVTDQQTSACSGPMMSLLGDAEPRPEWTPFWRWLVVVLVLVVVTVTLLARLWPAGQAWGVAFVVPVLFLLRSWWRFAGGVALEPSVSRGM